MSDGKKSLLFGVILLIVANLIYLDIKLQLSAKSASTVNTAVPSLTEEKTISTTPSDCTGECLKKVEEATKSLTLRLDELDAQVNSLGKDGPLQGSNISKPGSTGQKIFYIPLGAASTTSRTMLDLPSTYTIIDTNSYGQIQAAYFEASLSIPTNNGSVNAQLFDETAKHLAWYSTITTSSQTPVLVTSQPIVLTPGAHTYGVQLQSTLGAQAVMDFARVRIVVQ